MPEAFLIVTLVGLLAVTMAYRPIRWEPLSVFSFSVAWIAGELAFQNIVWQMVATALFIWAGALAAWEGWIGLAVAVVVWLGLVGLGVAGRRASRVTAAALDEVRTAAFPVPQDPTTPTWGRWWRVSRAIPLRSRTVEAIRDVDYWGDGLSRHRLDIYRPRLPTPHGAPVMVYIHGGAWVIGDKREQGKPMMYELVARGWVCVAINYRLSPRATWPDHIVDAKRALVWVKEHIAEYGGDPSFVAVSGGSAGGHLCSLLALTPGKPEFQPGFEEAETSVSACVPFYGVMDMTSSTEGSTRFGSGLVRMLERMVMKTKEADHPEVFRYASPTYQVHAGAPPFFVLHGQNDTLVPVETARVFVERLRAVSRQPVVFAELPLAQHAFDILASLRCQATTSAVADFLDGVRAAVPPPPADAADAKADRNADGKSKPTRILSDVESAPEF
ncbi:MAG TPA: alpha/beta hydrolase [Acidimicrobiales bacterium]|nr:alpha/beta hydrolase [Acidimicrobiales bacterium]